MTGELRYSIIPAAGLATRFLPASKAIPKELFPILNKPAIQYVIEESVGAEIDRVVFVSGAGKEALLHEWHSRATARPGPCGDTPPRPCR